MIRPYPRYHELYQKRGLSDRLGRAGRQAVRQARPASTSSSGRTWRGFIRWSSRRTRSWPSSATRGGTGPRTKSSGCCDKQLELLAEVVPLHRELAERGQVELTTTPFYHPILPLLCDKRLAREAMPDVDLPEHLEGYRRGRRDARPPRGRVSRPGCSAQKPRGMWPREGSVCQAMIPLSAEAGIQWIATDEEILACSTDGWVSRDGHGYLRNPEMLYRPWRVEEEGHSAADRLPRPRHERPDRLPLSALRSRSTPWTISSASSTPSATPPAATPAIGPRW